MSKAAATASGQQWYRTLNATQWKTLLASNLGWVFDGFFTAPAERLEACQQLEEGERFD
jgi:hypothetical protein